MGRSLLCVVAAALALARSLTQSTQHAPARTHAPTHTKRTHTKVHKAHTHTHTQTRTHAHAQRHNLDNFGFRRSLQRSFAVGLRRSRSRSRSSFRSRSRSRTVERSYSRTVAVAVTKADYRTQTRTQEKRCFRGGRRFDFWRLDWLSPLCARAFSRFFFVFFPLLCSCWRWVFLRLLLLECCAWVYATFRSFSVIQVVFDSRRDSRSQPTINMKAAAVLTTACVALGLPSQVAARDCFLRDIDYRSYGPDAGCVLLVRPLERRCVAGTKPHALRWTILHVDCAC